MLKRMIEPDQYSIDELPHVEPDFVEMIIGPGKPADNRRFGELMVRLRKNARLSRADAATAVGVSAEYLRLIELGRRTPALGQMRSFLDVYKVEGEIEKIQPDGSVADLIFADPLNDDVVVIEFNSRIREARRSRDTSARVAEDQQKDPDLLRWAYEDPSASRAADLGFVVSMLACADHSTIRQIRKLLQNELGNWADLGT